MERDQVEKEKDAWARNAAAQARRQERMSPEQRQQQRERWIQSEVQRQQQLDDQERWQQRHSQQQTATEACRREKLTVIPEQKQARLDQEASTARQRRETTEQLKEQARESFRLPEDFNLSIEDAAAFLEAPDPYKVKWDDVQSSPIKSLLLWYTNQGLMQNEQWKHYHRDSCKGTDAEECKKLGNDAFEAKKYHHAITCYRQAIKFDPNNHIYYCNMSACYAKLNKWNQSLSNAMECVRLDPTFAKGYSRVALAHINLDNYLHAKAAVIEGLRCLDKDTGESKSYETLIKLQETIDSKLASETKQGIERQYASRISSLDCSSLERTLPADASKDDYGMDISGNS